MKTTKKVAVSKKAVAVEVKNSPVVTFKKMAAKDAVPPQAASVLAVIKSLKTTTVAKLVVALKGKIETCQTPRAIWQFYRKPLIKGGYVSVAR